MKSERPADDLAAGLAALPHFRELSPELLAKVVGLSREIELAAGELLFHAGQRCDAFFVVCSGLVRVFRQAPDGREQVVHHIGPGHTFAEAGLFHHGIFPASAVAAEPSRLIRIDGPRFLRLFAEESGGADAVSAERVAVCRDAQRLFVREHLAWWVPAFALALRRKADGLRDARDLHEPPHSALGAVGAALAAFMAVERAVLDIAPPTELVEPRPDEELEDGCGGCSLHAETTAPR